MKFGIEQVGNDAPQWMTRLFTALVVVIIPSFGAMVTTLPPDVMTDKTKLLIGIFVTFGLSLIRGTMMLFGAEVTKKTSDTND